MLAPWTKDSAEWQELDARIDADDVVRWISDLVDRELDLAPLWQSYAGRGSQAHRPDLLVKLLLYEHYRGRPSPRKWLEDLRHEERVRWLTMGVTVKQTALYEFRDRVGKFLPAWNEAVLHRAVAEAHTTATIASLDGTTVAANASRHRLLSISSMQARIALLQQAVERDRIDESTATADSPQTQAETAVPPAWMAKTPAGREQQLTRLQKAKTLLEQRILINIRRRSDKRKDPADLRICPSDPEAVLGMDKLKTYRPLYNLQVMRDVSSDLILSFSLQAVHSDSGLLVDMIERTARQTGVALQTVLVDAGYVNGDNLAASEARGVGLIGPYQANSFTERKRQQRETPLPLSKDVFLWDGDNGQYLCPEGKPLLFHHDTTRQRANGESVPLQIYRADPEDCGGCSRRAECTNAKARTISRSPHEERIEAHRQTMASRENRALYEKRCQTVERAFADLKTHRHLDRFSGRGLDRGLIQASLTILAHNLVLLHKLRNQKPLENAA